MTSSTPERPERGPRVDPFARRQRAYAALLVLLVIFFIWKPWRLHGPETGAESPERLEYVEHVLGGADPESELPLIVLLHSLGDTAEHFAMQFAELGIEARLVVPSGPDWILLGASWFGPSSDHEELSRALELVREFVRHIRATRPTRGRPVIAGFSQGAELCYELAAEAPAEFAAIVPVSGALVRELGGGEYREPLPRIIALHGAADRRLRTSLARDTANALLEHCFEVELRIVPGAGHSLSLGMIFAFHDALRDAVAHAEGGAR